MWPVRSFIGAYISKSPSTQFDLIFVLMNDTMSCFKRPLSTGNVDKNTSLSFHKGKVFAPDAHILSCFNKDSRNSSWHNMTESDDWYCENHE